MRENHIESSHINPLLNYFGLFLDNQLRCVVTLTKLPTRIKIVPNLLRLK